MINSSELPMPALQRYVGDKVVYLSQQVFIILVNFFYKQELLKSLFQKNYKWKKNSFNEKKRAFLIYTWSDKALKGPLKSYYLLVSGFWDILFWAGWKYYEICIYINKVVISVGLFVCPIQTHGIMADRPRSL